MTRKHAIVLFLFFVLLLFSVPVAGAQQGLEDLDPQEILDLLAPRTENQEDLLFDILLYLIFFMSIISMFLIPDKQLMATMLNFVVILLAVLSKILVGDVAPYILEPTDLPVLPINAGMFVIPLMIAGMVRQRRGSPPAMITGIITGLLGGTYFFLFWFLKQRDYVSDEVMQTFMDFI